MGAFQAFTIWVIPLLVKGQLYKPCMLFATVANCKVEYLKSGRLDIRFLDIMVESPSYFEPYRPVLEQLKNITPDNFPFREYLVPCYSNVKSPQYLRIGILERHLQDGRGGGVVSICDLLLWRKADEVNRNDSQLEALKDALTKEFSVIQGPPGTAKTYFGLKIVRALLDNRHECDAEKKSAILMVCYTNHALDQFLEGVLKFQQQE
ncbi:unnamed protein product [Porites evermanni]|uniref:DNA2/NAM7 helicase helicase domain-containing protein n=1 Tax=Porites evermanni TaxID=104178 RepID=A0ABN8S1V6_9CNID|nr:unnamed protein product [Porites evermanni]